MESIVLVCIVVFFCLHQNNALKVYRVSKQMIVLSGSDFFEHSPKTNAMIFENMDGHREQNLQDTSFPPQLIINIKFYSSFDVKDCETFILLDQIYDPKTRKHLRIVNPYLIEVTRSEPIMMYPLDLSKIKTKTPSRTKKLYQPKTSSMKINTREEFLNAVLQKIINALNAAMVSHDSDNSNPMIFKKGRMLKSNKGMNQNENNFLYEGYNYETLGDARSYNKKKNITKRKNRSKFHMVRKPKSKFEDGLNKNLYSNSFHGRYEINKYWKHKPYNYKQLYKNDDELSNINDKFSKETLRSNELNQDMNIFQKKNTKRFIDNNEEVILRNKNQYNVLHDSHLNLREKLDFLDLLNIKNEIPPKENIPGLKNDLRSYDLLIDHLQKHKTGRRKRNLNVETPCELCEEGKGTSTLENNNCLCRNIANSCSCNNRKQVRNLPENWYSDLNMSKPSNFLITQLRVFQKHDNIWWKISPSIILNTISGIFCNANLSVLLSCHIDVFQLEKNLRLKENKLIIPQSSSLEARVYNWGNEHDQFLDSGDVNLREFSKNLLKRRYITPPLKQQRSGKRSRFFSRNGTYHLETIGELGNLHTSTNILAQCPYNEEHTCLNLFEEKVPAFNIKVKMPFRNNMILNSKARAQITKIITDATIKDALQVSINVLNKGTECKEFTVNIKDCPIGCSVAAKSSVTKVFAPLIEDTLTFLLPLIFDSKRSHRKFKCIVEVKVKTFSSFAKNLHRSHFIQTGNDTSTVAERIIAVEREKRCFCIWNCKCHCIDKIETHADFQVCEKLSLIDQNRAGLYNACDNGIDFFLDENMSNKSRLLTFIRNALLLIILMILLGLFKALLGLLFCKTVDKWGYNQVQPGRTYKRSSRTRRFFVNCIFFILLPILCWCKCFSPSEEDFLAASTEWHCQVMQAPLNENESINLTTNNKNKRVNGGEEVMKTNGSNYLDQAFESNILNIYDDNDEGNTKFVLKALEESRENLKHLLLQHSSTVSSIVHADQCEDGNLKDLASMFVEVLKTAHVVYRKFEQPIGNVKNIPNETKYCIQGYFIPSIGTSYEFINYDPLVQYRCFSRDGKNLEFLHSPILLNHKDMDHIYPTKLDVLNAADLTIHPPSDVPCINVSLTSSN